jgi:nucleoside-diphosphate-sugar epimerase
MNVFILGATGHVGRRLLEVLAETPGINTVGASRHKREVPPSGNWIQIDIRDEKAMRAALRGQDAVINCVAGSGSAIEDGTHTLVGAAKAVGCPRLVHLSTMSVYGAIEGRLPESTPRSPELGWYAKAKCDAEDLIGTYVTEGGTAIVLRPGCVIGPRSELWVGRIGRLLKAGRLGDLGSRGDGWSNLVHVDDVCSAIIASLEFKPYGRTLPIFNLSAPDSPRWNSYFIDLAVAINAVPVARIASKQLSLDCLAGGVPLKLLEKLQVAKRIKGLKIPDAITPGLLQLWGRHLQLDCALATKELNLQWTAYSQSLQDSASWFIKTAGSLHGKHNLSN